MVASGIEKPVYNVLTSSKGFIFFSVESHVALYKWISIVAGLPLDPDSEKHREKPSKIAVLNTSNEKAYS